eukprot:CAMPEP_0168597510 /NCGR_PEP_ID=MMETSP0420-20121227/10726_1 /TAXON_ID=498008 /ORGANISM="Pessonella sp." /LENGTH=69 /DNA_ID=CAMNT_0008634413 /DNA_START=35 /DNA_END=241 /DNA_ORIENTATION=+
MTEVAVPANPIVTKKDEQIVYIEEDDEFEEFASEWNQKDEDVQDKKQQWKDDWDDEEEEDNFEKQLRAE